MAQKKIISNKKTRRDMSNPFAGFSHNQLLKLANIKTYDKNFIIEKQQNGRIIVKPILNRKILKK